MQHTPDIKGGSRAGQFQLVPYLIYFGLLRCMLWCFDKKNRVSSLIWQFFLFSFAGFFLPLWRGLQFKLRNVLLLLGWLLAEVLGLHGSTSSLTVNTSLFLTPLSEPDRGMDFHAACPPQASGILACAFAWIHLSQGTWSNSEGITQLITPANCSVLAESYQSSPPHASLFHRALLLSYIRHLRNTWIFLYIYCTDVLIQAECERLLLLSWIKLLFADISCTRMHSFTVPPTPDFLSQRVKSQKLCKKFYLWHVCLAV